MAFTHAEGKVTVSLTVALPRTSCDIGILAHHGIERTDDPDYDFGFLQATETGWAELLGAGAIPYPQGHVHAGPADSRDATTPVYDAAWDAYVLAAGFGDNFTSGAWWRDVDIEPGLYRLEGTGTHAVDGGPEKLTRGGSLLVGLDCGKEFQVLGAGEDPGAVFFSAMGANGETDVSVELGTADFHQGSIPFEARGTSCAMRIHVNNPQGEISAMGPVELAFTFEATDSPTFSAPFLRHAPDLPAGVYTISWDLLSVYNSYWDIKAFCDQPVPPGQAVDRWSAPE